LPLLSYPFSYDQAVFADIADVMIRGGTVYRDAWEHKPPGVYYVYYLAFVLFGRDFWAPRLMEVLAIGVASAGLVRTAQRWFGSTAAGVVSALALPLLYLQLGKNSAQPESFQIPLLIWAMACWPIESDPGRVGLRSITSGVLLSLAVMFKTPVVTIAIVFWLDRLIQDWRNEGWREKLRPVLLLTLGLSSAPLAVLAYYSARGAFPEVWDALIVFPIEYNRWSLGRVSVSSIVLYREWIDRLLPAAALMLLLVGLVRGLRFRRRDTVRWIGVLAGAWANMSIQATRHIYLDMVLLPPLSLGFGLILLKPDSSVQMPRERDWKDHAARILGVLLLVLAGIQYVRGLAPLRNNLGRVSRVQNFEPEQGGTSDLVRYVRARTAPEDRIFIWGNEPLTYFLCDRQMAGPYSTLLPILPPWSGPGRLYPLMSRLGREKPRLVLVSPSEGGWWGSDIGPKKLLVLFPEMRQWMTEDYARIETLREYEIWERKP
jgi:4-amino-4-deoxy-L-arabinose transferase-like glycosyltransferase